MFPDKVLLSSAYFAPIEYFAALDNAKSVEIEAFEQYQKQSYRTRCHILAGNGILVLTVPVQRGSNCNTLKESTHKLPITDILIDYSKPWIIQHKRALEAAYGNSPFFEYYKDDIFNVIDVQVASLLELNTRLTTLICSLLNIKAKINLSKKYTPSSSISEDIVDLRNTIHPKIIRSNNFFYTEKEYFQVFSQKYGFVPNLSILDLLFNEGPNAISYL